LLPFVLMDCTGFPWRGRITSGNDRAAGAAADVASFMDEFGAFVRHFAGLGVAAGGVDAVLLGSELRGLTWLRDDAGGYPMVAALRRLAEEVRAIVGAETQIGYAADWSEYSGHQPADGSGDVFFHLDPLWADGNIDFVGIDWYAPLTDWREGDAHLDRALAASIYDPAYLQSRIRGGEGFDWYYASDADRTAQIRTPIMDGAYGEDWVFRPKDVAGWWSNAHHDRPGGVRASAPTAWVPGSKPIRFIEIGCAAIDKGPNAPNLFLDPKSSESAAPPFSTGERDDRVQRAYLEAFHDFYAAHNPLSEVYDGPMLSDVNIWCWDARPYPYFPQLGDVWGDAANWRTGHWLNGRMGSGEARNLIAAIAGEAGVTDLDLGEVSGSIDGYVIEQPMTAANALSPVLDWLGLELAEQGMGLRAVSTLHSLDLNLTRDDLAYNEQSPVMARRDLIEVPASLSFRAYDLDRDYQLQSVTVRRDAVAGASQAGIDLPLCVSAEQATAYAHYALDRQQSVRGTVQIDIDPLLALTLETGDGVAFEGLNYRVVRVDASETPSVTLEPAPAARAVAGADPSAVSARPGAMTPPVMTAFRLMELPCFGVDEANARPVMVATADPWAGADIYAGAGASSLKLRGRVEQMAGLGRTLSALPPQRGNLLLRQAFLDVYLEGAEPLSHTLDELLSGETYVCVRALNGEWEIIQYLNATATGVNCWRLKGLVRGQWGSEGALRAGLASGAEVVLLPAGVVRADMTLDELNLTRLWRAGQTGFGGSAERAIDSGAAWTGLALRPRALVHGRVVADGSDLRLSWIRVARFGGDSWDTEPPLCEDYERYHVRVWDGDTLKREVEVSVPGWTYAAADMAADFPSGLAGAWAEIAQKSQVFGWGAAMRLDLPD
ncbi:MAG: baseplate multidomain protein megatron, partial [Asticcacaulis sp.]